MRKNRYIILLMLILVIGSCQRIYCEQVQRDMFATVVIPPTFKLSLDNANISFGYTEPGKTVELYPYKHYNELKCVSNKGNRWYLKLSIIGSIIGPPDTTVKIDSFKWMVSQAAGDGVIEKGWHSFTEYPAIAYTSGLADSAGGEVGLQFKYRLDLPPTAKGGTYSLNVLYTMTDVP